MLLKNIKFINEGTYNINEQVIEAPFYLVTNVEIREISFVCAGADSSTQVEIRASLFNNSNFEDNSMEFDVNDEGFRAFVNDLGLDWEALDEKNRENLIAAYQLKKEEAAKAAEQIVEASHIGEGDILIVGCSSSEILGAHIGKGSSLEAAQAVYEGIQSVLRPRKIYLAAQCCEHLNRCVIVEKAALLPGTEICNVVPQLHAGGSFAMTVYQNAVKPVAVEEIKADAGLDIGDTLIGMHLKRVAVPVRIEQKSIGEAHVVAARTRPKFIGGSRAVYDDKLSGGDIPR